MTGSLRIYGRRRAEDRERIVSDALRQRRGRSAALIAAAEVWLKSRMAPLSKVATRCATGTNVSPLGSVTFAGRSASGPIPPGQSEAANDCECTDHDPDAVACHEALGHDLDVRTPCVWNVRERQTVRSLAGAVAVTIVAARSTTSDETLDAAGLSGLSKSRRTSRSYAGTVGSTVG